MLENHVIDVLEEIVSESSDLAPVVVNVHQSTAPATWKLLFLATLVLCLAVHGLAIRVEPVDLCLVE